MRVLFVVNHAGYFLTHRLSHALAAREAGYEVHIATPESRHAGRILAADLPWHPIRMTRSGRNPRREWTAVRDLVSLYRRLRPDLVHQVTSKPILYGTVAARLARVPAVVNAVAGLGHLHLASGRSYRWLRLGVGFGYRWLVRHPRMAVIFQNADDRDLFVSRRWVRAEQTTLIRGSGVDTSVFVPRPERGGDGSPTILFPSRMLSTKGLEELIEAARLLRLWKIPCRILLVGDPDPDNLASIPEPRIMEWVHEGLVEYLGRRNDMPEIFAQADIVCLPSYREGLPKSLLEAAAAGLPSVTTDVPGCRDVVRDGETGFVVPVRAVAPLAEALRRLVEDPALRGRMGARARELAESEFSLEQVCTETLDLYRRLLA